MVRFLVQMAGHAATGKSTLARQLALEVGGVVIDLDTIKTALLDADVDWDGASRGSYAVIYALVEDVLTHSTVSVIVDTPSYWPEIHERLRALAAAHDAAYRFVECTVDEPVRVERLASRPTKRSQIRTITDNPVDAPASIGAIHERPIARPPDVRAHTVDTTYGVNLDGLVAASAG